MSTFIVSKAHIDAIVTGTIAIIDRICLPETTYRLPKDASRMGEILLRENIRSVNYQYNTAETRRPYRYEEPESPPSPLSLLKLVNCLDYQSSKAPIYPGTQAALILSRIKDHCISKIIESRSDLLESFDNAPWTIPEKMVTDKLFDFGSKFAETYKATCPCGRITELSTQQDKSPEYYTDVYVRCTCGKSVYFYLPVN